jgi:hypothetical protein
VITAAGCAKLASRDYSRLSCEVGDAQLQPRGKLSTGVLATVYLVLDRAADLQTVVDDLLCGRYRLPLRE